MIWKAAAVGNWWLAASSGQHIHSRIMCHFVHSSLVKHQITQMTRPPYSPDLVLAIYGFFQNWNHLWKGRDFRPLMRFREIQWGSWWRLGELCEIPRCLLWRGRRCHCPMYNVSCVFLNKCRCFSYDMAGYLPDSPCTPSLVHADHLIIYFRKFPCCRTTNW